METRHQASVSVRNLVEFVMRSGDIDSGFISSSRTVEGTKGHQKVQDSGGENYKPEVNVSYIYKGHNMDIEVVGRIDGVIIEGERIIIDEIKTTTRDVNNIEETGNPRHWAQAKCYGFIYALQNDLEDIYIRLTYYNINTEEIISFERKMDIDELREFFENLVEAYLRWTEGIIIWNNIRDGSIRTQGFPFQNYRKGQRELAVAAYKTILREGKLFSQAPTGTGKTMAVLFPAIKAMGEGLTSRIFYLTAKTITRTVAENTIDIMRERGLRIRSLTLTAKEKICFNKEVNCNPQECEFARGHFDRANEALLDMLKEERLTREMIEAYARKHRVCPFEFSLDAALFSDVVICDYNYLFDPRASLKRFFGEGRTDYVFLVDEAHNLVDRSRDMFSAELQKGSFMDMKKAFKELSRDIYSCLNDINKYFITRNKEMTKDGFVQLEEKPLELYKLIRRFTGTAEEQLAKNLRGEVWSRLTELYFEALNFQRIFELYDENYTTYLEGANRDLRIKLLCLDPSKKLKEIMDKGRASLLFSATLSPMDYYMSILGGSNEDYRIKLPYPFPNENLCVMLDSSISTRFQNREESYGSVAEDIKRVVSRKGNYLVFFPSYKYMNEVYSRFIEISPETDTILQSPGMEEGEREDFLSSFEGKKDRTLLGFAVMGGLFGEGIDLIGDKLIGAIIVGVGLPQVSPERNIIREHFDRVRGCGFEYAYIYPGINKVMQAAGRVIRTEEDRGTVLLIDERFNRSPYRDLIPSEWKPLKRISKADDIERIIKDFWK